MHTNSELFHKKYRVETARSQSIDYDEGEFFVTFCTKYRNLYLGIIEDDVMYLSCIGAFLDAQIRNIKKSFPFVDVVAYTIMPNHAHILLTLDGSHKHVRVDKSQVDKDMRDISHCKSNLSNVIGRIKSEVTKFANRHKLSFGWQPRFYDSKVFDMDFHDNVLNYTISNVLNWKGDRFHPDNDDGQF